MTGGSLCEQRIQRLQYCYGLNAKVRGSVPWSVFGNAETEIGLVANFRVARHSLAVGKRYRNIRRDFSRQDEVTRKFEFM